MAHQLVAVAEVELFGNLVSVLEQMIDNDAELRSQLLQSVLIRRAAREEKVRGMQNRRKMTAAFKTSMILSAVKNMGAGLAATADAVSAAASAAVTSATASVEAPSTAKVPDDDRV